MKYINESLLDILSSIEKGEMPKEIGLDDFAPNAEENSANYDADKDPERKIKEAKALHSREQAIASNTKNNIYFEIQQAFYSMIEKKTKKGKIE